MGDIQTGETMIMTPLVVKAKVLVGNSGGEYGVRGWLAALEAASGKIAWRAFSSGPDQDLRAGAFHYPFTRTMPAAEKGQAHERLVGL